MLGSRRPAVEYFEEKISYDMTVFGRLSNGAARLLFCQAWCAQTMLPISRSESWDSKEGSQHRKPNRPRRNTNPRHTPAPPKSTLRNRPQEHADATPPSPDHPRDRSPTASPHRPDTKSCTDAKQPPPASRPQQPDPTRPLPPLAAPRRRPRQRSPDQGCAPPDTDPDEAPWERNSANDARERP
jgi:hypothetical protein